MPRWLENHLRIVSILKRFDIVPCVKYPRSICGVGKIHISENHFWPLRNLRVTWRLQRHSIFKISQKNNLKPQREDDNPTCERTLNCRRLCSFVRAACERPWHQRQRGLLEGPQNLSVVVPASVEMFSSSSGTPSGLLFDGTSFELRFEDVFLLFWFIHRSLFSRRNNRMDEHIPTSGRIIRSLLSIFDWTYPTVENWKSVLWLKIVRKFNRISFRWTLSRWIFM